ncbi:MAG: hypothetical protein J0I25_15360, partial [Sphingomonadales bacterium]|nr:hypothetical protein [Sphingomonadales bacterium]
MSAYLEIEEVSAEPEFGNCGRSGWGFTLWNAPLYNEPHRPLLERFSKQYPESVLDLPAHYPEEDCVAGSVTWQSHLISIWYEEILAYLRFWSADRATIESFRTALLPLAIIAS